MKKTLLLGAMLCAVAAVVGCGDKVNADLIIGEWTNTAESSEITLAGQENIPEGIISTVFTTDSVLIVDMRLDCISEWRHYTLTERDGKRMLHIDDGCPSVGDCIVEDLTQQKMVLAPVHSEIDMDFHYIMKRK